MRLADTSVKNMEVCKAFLHWKMYLSLYAAKGNWAKTFLYGRRNTLWVLNLKHSLDRLSHHFSFVNHILRARGRILFVECPPGLENYWERLVSLYGHDYVDKDTWLHGSINAHFSARSHTYSLVILYDADPDLGILQECLKADIPLLQFADIRQESLGVDYSIPYTFSRSPQICWYIEAWRSLLIRKKRRKNWQRSVIYSFFQWKMNTQKGKGEGTPSSPKARASLSSPKIVPKKTNRDKKKDWLSKNRLRLQKGGRRRKTFYTSKLN